MSFVSSASGTNRLLGLPAVPVIVLFILVSTLARFWICASLPILPDETYYFQWSKHLDASYFSKGPAIAYTIAAGTALWGPTSFGIRFFAVLLSAGTAWQLFVLARRWFDEATAVIAVLLTSVIPIYALGAVVMTIDPLSAFFWLWAANLFSQALETNRIWFWILTGFAVGSGFLAKFTNGLELVAFLLFLLGSSAYRRFLIRPGFWAMLVVSLLCTLPIWWWNQKNGWPTLHHLTTRADLDQPWSLSLLNPWKFLEAQALVISPALFVVLLFTAGRAFGRLKNDAERLMLFLFCSVFLFYLILSFHYVGEANWPTISYFSLVILTASWIQQYLQKTTAFSRLVKQSVILAFILAWLQMILLHATPFLPLSGRMDPISRFTGWQELSAHMQEERQLLNATTLIVDAYKEAAVISFYLPDQGFVYARQPETLRDKFGNEISQRYSQYDMWNSYEITDSTRALYLTEDASGKFLAYQFSSVQPIDEISIYFRGTRLRHYYLFLCLRR